MRQTDNRRPSRQGSGAVSLPLVCIWREPSRPLPQRRIQGLSQRGYHPQEFQAPPWYPTGRADEAFDFCGHMRGLCTDITIRCPEFAHIDVSRLLFGVTQARSAQGFGLQARVTPLRFKGGRLTRRRKGTAYQVQRYFVGEQEMLYVLTFCLPRFLDQDFEEKFITVFHELYHISPEFDGDLRRHTGRYSLHSHSKRRYDLEMARLARNYLASGAPPNLHAFMRLNFAQLQHRHGEILGVVVPRPRLIPIPARLASGH